MRYSYSEDLFYVLKNPDFNSHKLFINCGFRSNTLCTLVYVFFQHRLSIINILLFKKNRINVPNNYLILKFVLRSLGVRVVCIVMLVWVCLGY